jgi:hypothetical protein
MKVLNESARRFEFLSTVHARMRRCAFVTRRVFLHVTDAQAADGLRIESAYCLLNGRFTLDVYFAAASDASGYGSPPVNVQTASGLGSPVAYFNAASAAS